MAKQSLSQIKNWFRTRLKPTQQQYWDVWDSFWHKDQKIPTATVEGLNEILTGKASQEFVNSIQENSYKYWILGTVTEIGDVLGGGIVFYIAPDKSYALVCSEADLGGSERWCFNESETNPFLGIAGIDHINIGSGGDNTDKIIAALDALGQSNYAAKMCRDYRGGGFDDWCLPAADELAAMLKNLHEMNGFNVGFHKASSMYTLLSNYYWSSSSGNWDEYHNEKYIYRLLYNVDGIGTEPMWNCYQPDMAIGDEFRFGRIRPVRKIELNDDGLKVKNADKVKIIGGGGIVVTTTPSGVITISLANNPS